MEQHNKYVFKELVGLSEAAHRQLEEEQYVSTDYLPDVDLSPRDRSLLAQTAHSE